MFENIKRGLEIRHIRDAIAKINKHIEEKKIREIDISVLVKYVRDLRRLVEKTPAEISTMKNFCRGLKRAFYHSVRWKNVHLLNKASIQTINLLAIADSVTDDPRKAIREYGDLAAIRSNISISLKYLADALTAVIDSIKSSENNNKAA